MSDTKNSEVMSEELKEVIIKCLCLMKLNCLLKQNLITEEEYLKIKKKSKNFGIIEKASFLCYNFLEITISTILRRENGCS